MVFLFTWARGSKQGSFLAYLKFYSKNSRVCYIKKNYYDNQSYIWELELFYLFLEIKENVDCKIPTSCF